VSVEDTVLTTGADARREQILRAALEVISGRGFSDTRIADVAQRAGVSPALVIYYFRTKDHVLSEALRFAEDRWYESAARRTASIETAEGRLEEVVAMSCLPDADGQGVDAWSVRLDLWAQASHNEDVGRVREEFDEHWRETIRTVVREGQRAGEFRLVDVDEFALLFAALLDGLSVQLALDDPVVDAWRAFEIAMRLAAQLLGFEWSASTSPYAGKGQRGRSGV
jgi:AcrR family transcriptional regulator